jgi:hypothetical protein
VRMSGTRSGLRLFSGVSHFLCLHCCIDSCTLCRALQQKSVCRAQLGRLSMTTDGAKEFDGVPQKTSSRSIRASPDKEFGV